MRSLWTAASLAAAICVAPAAFATEVTAQDVVRAIHRAGGAATAEAGSNGLPSVTATAGEDGLNFGVNLYNCTGTGLAAACDTVQFRAYFTHRQTPQQALQTVNTYNANWVFGRAYVEEAGKAYNDFVVEHVLVVHPGRKDAVLDEELALWLNVLGHFYNSIAD